MVVLTVPIPPNEDLKKKKSKQQGEIFTTQTIHVLTNFLTKNQIF